MSRVLAVIAKPDDCPLRTMPEKREIHFLDDKSEYYRQGWNACIDAMEGGVNKNEV